MKYINSLLLFALSCNLVSAAISITIAPNGSGGTTFQFNETTANPNFPIANASGAGFRIELPPSMFSPLIIAGGGTIGEISGYMNPIVATFTDGISGFSYEADFLSIGGDLSYGYFDFDRPFSPAQGQTEGRMDLVEGAAVTSTISPDALVMGTHTISSSLFGTVTVNVIPEPTSVLLVALSSLLLLRRNRRTETAVEIEEQNKA
jgi:hypothetical protein